VSGHHSHRGGNLQHSVEVAELVRTILPWFPDASHDIATAAALLHDIGKSLEYEEDKNGSVTGLSFRGRLIGHKLLTVQIVTVAMLEARLSLVERVGLIHAISAVPAPDWVGLRCPATPEAAVLSFADRISGKAHLIEKIAAPNGGWGQYHKHNGGRIFTVVDQRRNNRYGRNI
jgi:3'-5' exoribonuclease